MNSIFWIILLAANTLGALVFALYNRKKGAYALLSIFFVMMPVVGFIIFAVALCAWHMKNFTYDRESLVHRAQPARVHSMPETVKELDVIPVEDAMAVSSNSEKRQLMLEQLKKDINNYKTILSAASDEDSETAHYVAAAKLEIYNKLILQLKQATYILAEQQSTEAVCAVLDCYINMIESHILAAEEVTIYHSKYTRDFEASQRLVPNLTETQYYSFYIHCLVALGDNDRVKDIWSTCPSEGKTEELYREVLEMYYSEGDKVGFYEVLDELCGSDLALSAEGADMLRFWLSKRRKAAVVA